jgi:hypothetical protein
VCVWCFDWFVGGEGEGYVMTGSFVCRVVAADKNKCSHTCLPPSVLPNASINGSDSSPGRRSAGRRSR